MIKLALTAVMVLAATSILAQDTQQCEAEGGCIIVTRAGLMAVLQAAVQSGYKQGLRACNSNI